MSSPNPAPRLTPTQLGALVILMASAREVTNSELEELARFRLNGGDRRGLEALGLLETRKVGRVLAFQLTDQGWRFCKQLHQADVEVGGSRAARSIFVLLDGVHRSLDRLRVSHADFFKDSPGGPDIASAPTAMAVAEDSLDLEARVRSAYRALVRRPGQWVGLADIRDSLPGVPSAAVDEALRAMAHQAGVRIIPVANVKALDDRDRAAALHMGGDDHHALSIGPA